MYYGLIWRRRFVTLADRHNHDRLQRTPQAGTKPGEIWELFHDTTKRLISNFCRIKRSTGTLVHEHLGPRCLAVNSCGEYRYQYNAERLDDAGTGTIKTATRPTVASLVLKMFPPDKDHPIRPEGAIIRHRNGDSLDNSCTNLEYVQRYKS